jgi:4'-phosphopantetheinyl transferase
MSVRRDTIARYGNSLLVNDLYQTNRFEVDLMSHWVAPNSSGLQPRLAENDVHVWCADLDLEPPALERLAVHLSSEEKVRAARFVSATDRNRFTVARAILRELLGGYLQLPPANIRIEAASHGKPALPNAPGVPDLRFNLSHSHGLALYAFVLQREIGIDVEKIRPEFVTEKIAERFFSARERDGLRRLPSELHSEAFFLCWTRKEAYIKARGEGLHIPLDSFDVTLTPNEAAVLTSTDSDRWKLHGFHPRPGFVGALVVEAPENQLHFWEWSLPRPT